MLALTRPVVGPQHLDTETKILRGQDRPRRWLEEYVGMSMLFRLHVEMASAKTHKISRDDFEGCRLLQKGGWAGLAGRTVWTLVFFRRSGAQRGGHRLRPRLMRPRPPWAPRRKTSSDRLKKALLKVQRPVLNHSCRTPGKHTHTHM